MFWCRAPASILVTVEDYSTTVDAANTSVSVTFSEYEVEKA